MAASIVALAGSVGYKPQNEQAACKLGCETIRTTRVFEANTKTISAGGTWAVPDRDLNCNSLRIRFLSFLCTHSHTIENKGVILKE